MTQGFGHRQNQRAIKGIVISKIGTERGADSVIPVFRDAAQSAARQNSGGADDGLVLKYTPVRPSEISHYIPLVVDLVEYGGRSAVRSSELRADGAVGKSGCERR